MDKKTLEERVKSFQEEYIELQKKHGIDIKPVLHFIDTQDKPKE